MLGIAVSGSLGFTVLWHWGEWAFGLSSLGYECIRAVGIMVLACTEVLGFRALGLCRVLGSGQKGIRVCCRVSGVLGFKASGNIRV